MPENRELRRGARLAAALAVLGIACAAPVRLYSGPERPREEVSVLRAIGPTAVLEVDHQRVPRLETSFQVNPGQHAILVRLHGWVCLIQVETRAGEIYSIRSGRRGREYEAWVTDAKGQEVEATWIC